MVLYKGEGGCRPGREPVARKYKVAVIWDYQGVSAAAFNTRVWDSLSVLGRLPILAYLYLFSV